MRDLIFISYSRKDKAFFDAFRKNLNPAESNDLLVWSDQKIEAGSKWEPKLREALAKTRRASSVVTPTATLLSSALDAELCIAALASFALTHDDRTTSGIRTQH